jgi:hypothetical protein
LNILALVLSAGALLVSTSLARLQSEVMRHANQLPILVNLIQEFRSS